MKPKTIISESSIIDVETGEVTPVEKPKYRSNDNYLFGQFEKDMEICDSKSMTIPNESYSIREILEKFTRGLPLDVIKQDEYDGIEEFDGNEQENPIDITDVTAELESINERIEASKLKSVEAKKTGGVSVANDDGEVKPQA